MFINLNAKWTYNGIVSRVINLFPDNNSNQPQKYSNYSNVLQKIQVFQAI